MRGYGAMVVLYSGCLGTASVTYSMTYRQTWYPLGGRTPGIVPLSTSSIPLHTVFNAEPAPLVSFINLYPFESGQGVLSASHATAYIGRATTANQSRPVTPQNLTRCQKNVLTSPMGAQARLASAAARPPPSHASCFPPPAPRTAVRW